jgi:hypothetical protein
MEGIGVPKDILDGFDWIHKAAEQGYAPAQNRIGLCYLTGEGVTKDYLQAYEWFNLAAAQGGPDSPDVRVNLAKAGTFLTPEQIANAQHVSHGFKPHKADVPAPNVTNAPAETQVGLSKSGFLNVKSQDDNCEVFIDGAFVGNTPAKVKLEAGTHVVEVKRSGFKDYRKSLQVSEGSELSLNAVLAKE